MRTGTTKRKITTKRTIHMKLRTQEQRNGNGKEHGKLKESKTRCRGTDKDRGDERYR